MGNCTSKTKKRRNKLWSKCNRSTIIVIPKLMLPKIQKCSTFKEFRTQQISTDESYNIFKNEFKIQLETSSIYNDIDIFAGCISPVSAHRFFYYRRKLKKAKKKRYTLKDFKAKVMILYRKQLRALKIMKIFEIFWEKIVELFGPAQKNKKEELAEMMAEYHMNQAWAEAHEKTYVRALDHLNMYNMW